MTTFFRRWGGRARIVENYEFTLKDAQGRVKPLFQLNRVGQALLKLGVLSPLTPKWLLRALFLGNWATTARYANLKTNAGLAGVASRINGAGGEAVFTYIAIGTGTTAPSASDTALQSEITTGGGARKSGTVSRETTTVTNDTATVQATFNFTASFNVSEAGLFNASTGGTMLSRDTFSAIPVASGDSLQITIKVQVS